ncbi:hypothetical protein [Streptomyces sp. NPDC005303]|uniref:hypothetical protein n=1 Tax=Streptomyces sp. NPDC005303 TaxID=3155713 RepID=UPI0033A49A46
MIELLKFLVETLTQGLPGLTSARGEKKRRALAVELFLLYVRCNEAMITADSIVSLLNRYGQAGADQWNRHWLKQELKESVQRQYVTVRSLTGLLSDQSEVMWIIDSDPEEKLDVLMNRKSGRLIELLGILHDGHIPLDVDLDLLGEEARSVRLSHSAGPLYARFTVSLSNDFGRDARDFREYMESGVPQNQISEIRAALRRFREALESNFSIADVLVDVGDRRLN